MLHWVLGPVNVVSVGFGAIVLVSVVTSHYFEQKLNEWRAQMSQSPKTVTIFGGSGFVGRYIVRRMAKDGWLIAKRLCNFPAKICASPDFVKKFGMPNRPSDLRHIPAIQYTNATTGPSLSFKSQDGIEEAIQLTPAMYANSIEMLLESTLKGIGFVRAPAFAVNEHLKEGRLIHLLPKYQSIPERGVYAMYPDKRFLPLKVRKFIDLISDNLGNMDQDFKATVDHFTPVAEIEIKQ